MLLVNEYWGNGSDVPIPTKWNLDYHYWCPSGCLTYQRGGTVVTILEGCCFRDCVWSYHRECVGLSDLGGCINNVIF